MVHRSSTTAISLVSVVQQATLGYVTTPSFPVVGFRVLQTLERFELWGAHEGLFLPSLSTQRFHGLAR